MTWNDTSTTNTAANWFSGIVFTLFKLRDHLSFAIYSLEVLSMALTMLLQFQIHESLSQQTTAIECALGKVLSLRIARQEFKSSHAINLNK